MARRSSSGPRRPHIWFPLLILILSLWSPQDTVRVEGRTLQCYFEPPPSDVVSFLLAGGKPRTRYLYNRKYNKVLVEAGVEDDEFKQLSPAGRDNLVSLYLVR